MEQLNREQAIAIHESGDWQTWTDEQIVRLQLFQERLCVPFERYHAALEAMLGRGVWTHEFTYPESVRAEYLGLRPAPTLDEILNLIPAEKRVVVYAAKGESDDQS